MQTSRVEFDEQIQGGIMKITQFPAIAGISIILLLTNAGAQRHPPKATPIPPSRPSDGLPQCNKNPRYKDPPFPPNCSGGGHCSDEFPANSEWLESAEAFDLKNHAWYVYSNIIQPASTADASPRWRTWYDLCDAFHTQEVCEDRVDVNGIPSILRPPVELRNLFETSAVNFVSPLGRVSQEILFNEDAWYKVCSQGLGDPTVLSGLRKAALADRPPRRFVGAFDGDHKAIVVKAFWLDITPTDNRIPYMQNYPSESIGHEGCINWACWKSTVKVDPDPSKSCEPVSDHQTVGLKCFYTYPISGSTRVLLGLHLITHEATNWTWSTFWWHPREPATSSRPRSVNALPVSDSHGIQPPWTDYWMDTTISSTTRTYNPYLEGALPNGTHSNCLICHQKAVYFGKRRELDQSVKRANQAYFTDGIRTDYLWSVADNAAKH
jgi:hypothetical protein